MPYIFFPLENKSEGVLIGCNDIRLLRDEIARIAESEADDPYESFDWKNCGLDVGFHMAKLAGEAGSDILVFDEEPEHERLEPEDNVWDTLIGGGGDPGLLIRVLSEAADGAERIRV